MVAPKLTTTDLATMAMSTCGRAAVATVRWQAHRAVGARNRPAARHAAASRPAGRSTRSAPALTSAHGSPPLHRARRKLGEVPSQERSHSERMVESFIPGEEQS